MRAWLLIVLIAAVCGGAVWGVAWYRSRDLTTAALLKRLPSSGALVVYVDFAALRRAGILDRVEASKLAEDADYTDFVRKTDFDYKQDLDAAVAAFAPTGKFLLLRGQFDWKSLRSYVTSENGTCYNSLCRMQGSTQDRRISFFPLQTNLMALAVSEDESAAIRMQDTTPGPVLEAPDAPVWLSIPVSLLRSGDLPAGTRPFARAIEKADALTLSFSPDGNRVAAKLNVRCHTPQDASELATQLSRATSLLREVLQQNHQPADPTALSGVLTAGIFHSEGIRVFGYWPIEKSFLDSIFSGS
ncbi:MAG TPA: hypothetical protein VH640_30830 [Bryobacteraceae bacterium]